jgi:molybdate transport system substrate-binding protein
VYPAAVIKASKNPEAAADFLNFLSSDTAKRAYEEAGFGVEASKEASK